MSSSSRKRRAKSDNQIQIEISKRTSFLKHAAPSAAVLRALEVKGVGGVDAGNLLLVHVGLGGNVLVDVGLGKNLFVDVRFGFDLLVDIGLGSGVVALLLKRK